MPNEIDKLVEDIRKWILQKNKFGTLTIVTDRNGDIQRVMKHVDENMYVKVPDPPPKHQKGLQFVGDDDIIRLDKEGKI